MLGRDRLKLLWRNVGSYDHWFARCDYQPTRHRATVSVLHSQREDGQEWPFDGYHDAVAILSNRLQLAAKLLPLEASDGELQRFGHNWLTTDHLRRDEPLGYWDKQARGFQRERFYARLLRVSKLLHRWRL